MKCPVCQKEKLPRAMKNHIRKTAMEEVYVDYVYFYGKHKSSMPHQRFINENSVSVTRQDFKINQLKGQHDKNTI